eukprot:g21468.t1
MPRLRPVVCVETGEEYASLSAAARQLNLYGQNSIWNSIKNGTKSGGYHWRYKGVHRVGRFSKLDLPMFS